MSNKKVVYDIMSTPDGADLTLIMRVYQKHGVLIYSSMNGNAPVLFDPMDDKEQEADTLIDVGTVGKEKLKEIQKLLKSEK